MAESKPAPSKPRPLFIYGTLRALPLLAWVLTGDASNTTVVSKLVQPAKLYGYARFSIKDADYPAVIKHEPQSSVDGYLLTVETRSQRKKVDDFEGESYHSESVAVTVFEADGEKPKGIVEADVYLWIDDTDALTSNPWDLETFEKERLSDWIELFGGMELVGESDYDEMDL